MSREPIGDAGRAFRGLPFLEQHDGNAARANGGQEQPFDHVRRERVGEVAELRLFAVIYAATMVPAQPLGPAVQNHDPSRFFTRCGWIADEEDVNLESVLGQSFGEIRNANAKPSGLRPGVWAFERHDHEHGAIRPVQGAFVLVPGSCSGIVHRWACHASHRPSS